MAKKLRNDNCQEAVQARFGAVVRRYRSRLGISQEELAWRADMHRTYLADIERGMRNVSLLRIVRLVDALGLTLGRFFSAMEQKHLLAPASRHASKSSAAKAEKTRSGMLPPH